MGNQKAFLVIDMQKGSFTPKTPSFDTIGVVKRINELAELFREFNFPVVFIQHDGSGTGAFEKYDADWEILDDLIVGPDDVRIDKYANDVVYKSELHLRLKELNVGELVITGCATDFCVGSTIQSALRKDYDITVVEDGHTTAQRPHLKAEDVIAHYTWVWHNMIPTKGQIKLEKAKRIKMLCGQEL